MVEKIEQEDLLRGWSYLASLASMCKDCPRCKSFCKSCSCEEPARILKAHTDRSTFNRVMPLPDKHALHHKRSRILQHIAANPSGCPASRVIKGIGSTHSKLANDFAYLRNHGYITSVKQGGSVVFKLTEKVWDFKLKKGKS